MVDGVFRRRRLWPWLILVLFLAAGGAAAARRSSMAQKVKLDPLLLVKARRADLVVEVVETGRIEAREKVEVKSKVAGQVEKVYVDAGQRVVAGQPLLRLDPTDYHREVARARADLLAATNALRFAQLKLRHAERGWESRSVAEIELETARAEVTAKLAAKMNAEVGLQAANDKLRYTLVTAPMAGIVTERGIQPGEVVTPGVQATFEGKALLTISDLSKLIVKADLNQIDIAKVELGQQVTLGLDALPGRKYNAVVTKIAAAAVTPKGKEVETFPIEATLQDADERIKPGMTADIRVHIDRRSNVLVVPVEAVVTEEDKRYVTRVLGDGEHQTTERIEVKVGARNDREVQISSGLLPDEVVLIKPDSSAANEYTE